MIDPDPLTAARKIAKVLLGLLEPETARLLATKAAERGEPWLYDHWRDHLADGSREAHADIYTFTPRGSAHREAVLEETAQYVLEKDQS